MVKLSVIAIVGMPGAGKSLVSAVAQSHQLPVLVCGDVIREETERRGLEPTRSNMAEVMLAIRRKEGPTVVAERLIPKIESSASPVVVVEGVRSMAEVRALRKHHSVAVLSVHASPRTRYERLKARGRSDDPKSWEEFSERDLRELGVGIGDVIALADGMLVNETEEKALEAASEAILSKMARE
jgi:dephospho-CoA kinase